MAISDKIMDKLQNDETLSSYAQPFADALSNNPAFKKHIDGLGWSAGKLGDKLTELSADPANSETFVQILEDAAQNPDTFDVSKIKTENLQSTIAEYQGIAAAEAHAALVESVRPLTMATAISEGRVEEIMTAEQPTEVEAKPEYEVLHAGSAPTTTPPINTMAIQQQAAADASSAARAQFSNVSGTTYDGTSNEFIIEEMKKLDGSEGLVKILEDNPEFTSKLSNALINDVNLDTQLQELLGNGQAGSDRLADITETLQDPKHREFLGRALDQVAASDTINGNHLIELVNASENLQDNPLSSGAKDRFIKASVATGFTEEESNALLLEGASGTIMEFAKDLFQDPAAFFGRIGNWMDENGMPGGSFVASLGPMITKIVGGLQSFYGGDMFDDYRDLAASAGSGMRELGDHAKMYAAKVDSGLIAPQRATDADATQAAPAENPTDINAPSAVTDFQDAAALKEDIGVGLEQIITNKGSLSPEYAANMLENVDPAIKEEMKLIEQNPTLNGKFNDIVNIGTVEEVTAKLAEMHEQMQLGKSANDAINHAHAM